MWFGRPLILLVNSQNRKEIAITLWEREQTLRATDEAANALRADTANQMGVSETPTAERFEVAVFEA